jgi:glycosyltransferase involved in cell wall biosynthesis
MADPLVTVGLPVYNGAETIRSVADSVLAQDYGELEFLISDNGSTDDTEEICRELARSDGRVRYERHPHNLGVVANFEWTKGNARGEFVRWIGDTDEIVPSYVSRCVEMFTLNPKLILVTTQLAYITNEGNTETTRYEPTALGSDDPVARVSEMLKLLTQNYQLLDPLYGMARVGTVSKIVHDQMLRADEVYATKLALAGPWGHIPEILATRRWNDPSPSQLAATLRVPVWKTRIRGILEARRMLEVIDEAGLAGDQRRRARAAVLRFYAGRHWSSTRRRARRVREKLAAR